MNDYEFGTRLYELRKDAKMSQSDLAKLLDVTYKSVSKWETGMAKPGIDILNKLAIIFKVKLEDLLNGKAKSPNITKIVITGGPCAGKSSAISYIENEFTKRGYHVVFVSETATDLINAGLGLSNYKTRLEFQKNILTLQMTKEKLYYEGAMNLNKEKVLMVCDRGTLDSKAFMEPLDYQNLLRICNVNEIELRDNYDAVFHLVSASKGASEFYTLENNKARSESIEEARICDDKILESWTGHPHLRVIDNSTDFKEKMIRLLKEIALFLGEPEPFEIERKYLIEYPDIKKLEKLKNCEKVDIMQTYLLSDNDDEVRIRQRGKDGHYIYYKTVKRKINNLKRVETEKRLNKDEYLDLLMKQDPKYKQIKKSRYCIMYKGIYYEIDIFPFWNDKAIMEVELRDENQKVQIPPFVKLIKEVTDDEMYKNRNLAKI